MSSSVVSAGADAAVRVIVGPTAAGKSAVAMRLCERFGGAIVTADSRQLYRGFDIGTAKPSAAEQAHVRHFGLDVADPGDRWSAARWADAAEHWIGAARTAGMIPLVVGGTGFYIRALADPLDGVPALDPERRLQLLPVLDALPTEELRRWTTALDPARAHLGRVQLVRAVETALLSGERLSSRHTDPQTRRPGRAPLRYLVVDPGPVLAGRIAERVDVMLADGWLAEVARLTTEVPPHAPAWQSTGYDTFREHLAGRCTLAHARERVMIATRQYAKRQRTWFRHQLPPDSVTHVDPNAPDLDARLDRWWAGDA